MIGDYWDCVSRDDPALMVEYIDRLHDYAVIDPRTPGDAAPPAAVLFTLTDGPLSVALWMERAANGVALNAALPFVEPADVGEVVVESVQTATDDGFGFLRVQLGGVGLEVFDLLHPARRTHYRTGERLPFALSALAIQVERLGAIMEAINGRGDTAERLAQLIESGGSMLAPIPSDRPLGHYYYYGPITKVHRATCAGREVVAGTLALQVTPTDRVSIPVVFGTGSVRTGGWAPADGEFVAAAIFLHGRGALAEK